MTNISTSGPLVPSDFPRKRPLATVSGAHPKLAVRLVDDVYVADFTDEEVAARFAICDDLLVQLLSYCQRKRVKHPHWTTDGLLKKVASSLQTKGWDLTEAEIAWLVAQLAKLLGADRQAH